MAKCKKGGIGLYERFHACETMHGMSISKNWEQIRKLLSDRVMYMVYEENIEEGEMNDGYVMDVFLGGKDSTLGIEVAASLKTFIPFCHYCDIGKDIVITDYPNLENVTDCVHWDAGWVVNPNAVRLQKKYVFVRGKVETYEGLRVATFEDKRFLVILEDSGKKVHMRIYKKCNP